MRMRLAGLLVVGLVTAFSSLSFAEGAEFNPTCTVASLKQAIVDANGSAGHDTIVLPLSCEYTLDTVDNVRIDGDNGLPLITGPLTITGNGSTIQRSSAPETPAFRLLESIADVLEINTLTLSGGYVSRVGASANGGIIRTSGHLDLWSVDLAGGIAEGELSVFGGLIYADGNVSMVKVDMSASAVIITGNGFAGGGALHAGGRVVASSSSIQSASTVGSGTITDLVISGGAVSSGGGVSLFGSSITSGSSIGSTVGNGGCVFTTGDTDVRESTIELCTVTGGGVSGGAVFSSGSILVSLSTISGSAVVSTSVTGSATFSGGPTNIEYSRVSGNTGTSSAGNAIGTVFTQEELNAVNSTFSGNTLSATGEAGGGATYSILDTKGTNVTFAGNLAFGTVFSGGQGPEAAGTLTLTNSLVVSALGPACAGLVIAVNTQTVTNQPTCGLATVFADPGLDPTLQDNGGATFTHALLSGANAIGLALDCEPYDQRGQVRPGGACDPGAYESAGTPGAIFDVNCDKVADTVDVIAVLNALAGISSGPQPTAPCSPDVNFDRQLTLRDAVFLRQWLAGLIVIL